MSFQKGARPLAHSSRCVRQDTRFPLRFFTRSAASPQPTTDTHSPATSPPPPSVSNEAPLETMAGAAERPRLTPTTAISPRQERKLMREQSKLPIGSRRRRAAMRTGLDVPFVELPYQCFQEARMFLLQDRQEKVEQIRVQRERIARLQDRVVVDEKEQLQRDTRLKSMRTTLEELKIKADINDPMVKKRFEDGHGDMSKPIYRHLADRKWRSYKRLVLMQRITQMNVIPDVVPHIDPTVSTSLSFPSPAGFTGKRRNIEHGEIVDSRVSELPPTIHIQRYENGEKLYTIAVVDPDVPDVKLDGFVSRCHFLACNVPVTPTSPLVQLGNLSMETQVVFDWLPPYSQKGLPYQRLAVLILEQPPTGPSAPGSGAVVPSQSLDTRTIKEKIPDRNHGRMGFSLRGFISQYRTKPVGADLFRTIWDDGTAGIMRRHNIIGSDVEFKRMRVEPLPYQRLKEERYR